MYLYNSELSENNTAAAPCTTSKMQRTHLREGDEGVAPGLSHHGTALVEQHVELLDGAAFLHQFEELKPIGGNAKGTISTSESHGIVQPQLTR